MDKVHEAGDQEEQKAACLDCGKLYADFSLDLLLPRSQWLEINPQDGGILCPNCIVERASKLPGVLAVRAVIEIAPKTELYRIM